MSAFFTNFMCLRNVSHKSAFRIGDNGLGVQFEACFIRFGTFVKWKAHFLAIISTVFIAYTGKNRLD